MKKIKVYIAGKITGDPEYKEKFSKAKAALEKEGYIVITSADLPSGMTNGDYMRICFAMIDTADAVVFLPDWTNSKGARVERAYCSYIGKEIADIVFVPECPFKLFKGGREVR